MWIDVLRDLVALSARHREQNHLQDVPGFSAVTVKIAETPPPAKLTTGFLRFSSYILLAEVDRDALLLQVGDEPFLTALLER